MATWAGSEMRREAAVGSTNQDARAWARAGAPHGAVIVAERQTAGRGRRGNAWASDAGGLFMSMVLRPDIDVGRFPLLSYVTALAVRDAIASLVSVQVDLKWPNDVLSQGKKVSGILLEKEGNAAVVGMGINVNQRITDFPPDVREKASSLSILHGSDVSIDALLNRILDEMERRVDSYVASDAFFEEYRMHCITLSSHVRVVGGDADLFGVAQALDAQGALIVRDAQGVDHTVFAGDVSIRGMDGYV